MADHDDLAPRKGMPSATLDEATFKQRFVDQFRDPAFDPIGPELAKVADAAWSGYSASRKSPHTSKAACSHCRGGAPASGCLASGARASREVLAAKRAYMSRRNVEDLAARHCGA